jgi:hypothetical protein
VGTVATDVVIGKGVGIALEGLKQIKPIATLLTKLEDLKSLAKVKVAEMFSDQAAQIASQRIKQALRNPALYSGLAGAEFLGDLTKFAGNKLKNGAVTFKQFVAEATKEFGDGIKGKVDDLATAYRDAMQKTGFGNEIVELDIEQTKKIAKNQFQRETGAARQKLLEGIQEAENKGALQTIKNKNPDDYEWLQQNPRHKELAFDPDTKEYKIGEAKAALEAEKQGVLEGPVSRGIHADGGTHGDDYFDGNGIAWDVKDARLKDVDDIVKKIIGGENILIDGRNITGTEFKSLKTAIETKLPASAKGKVRFIQ